MKKHLKLLLTMILISCMLCGCGALDSLTGGKRAKTAEEVVENFNNKGNTDNGHMDLELDFHISASSDGISMEIPVNLSMSMDSFDSNNMYARMNVKASIFGMSADSTNEIYIAGDKKDGVKVYTYESDDDNWYVSDGNDEDIEDTMKIVDLSADAFKDAEMTYDKKEKLYTITQPLKNFKNDSLLSGSTSPEDMLNSLGFESDIVDKIYEKATVVYVFDSDYNLVSIDISGAEYSGPVESGGSTVDTTFKMGLSVKYNNVGNIKKSDVEVPQSVIDKATDVGSMYDDSFGSFDGDFDFGSGSGSDDSFGGYDEDEGFTFDEDEGSDTTTDDTSTPTVGNFQELPDMLGAYNGTVFNASSNSWDDTFGADGWVLEENDSEYMFVVAHNDKYPYATLFVSGVGVEYPTINDITTNGFSGYELDFGSYDGNKFPNATWNGLTFGARLEDIIAVYGQPQYDTYHGSMYDNISYKIGDNTELEFYVYPEGLRSVELNIYNF